MKDREGKARHKKRYSKISIEKRLKLIKMVLEEGLALTKVAKLLHIKRPTAKVIIKRYKQNGTFFQKKMTPVRTRETIGSNQELKIQEPSQQNVSIQVEPEPSPQAEPPNQPEPEVEEQEKDGGQHSYLIYYPPFPPFPQYHGFM